MLCSGGELLLTQLSKWLQYYSGLNGLSGQSWWGMLHSRGYQCLDVGCKLLLFILVWLAQLLILQVSTYLRRRQFMLHQHQLSAHHFLFILLTSSPPLPGTYKHLHGRRTRAITPDRPRAVGHHFPSYALPSSGSRPSLPACPPPVSNRPASFGGGGCCQTASAQRGLLCANTTATIQHLHESHNHPSRALCAQHRTPMLQSLSYWVSAPARAFLPRRMLPHGPQL